MIKMDEGVMYVVGRLTIDTASAIFSQGLPRPNTAGEVVVDLTQVEVVDSAAVSLMLGWVRAAQRGQVKISIVNVPNNLMSLANLYEVAADLPIKVRELSAQESTS